MIAVDIALSPSEFALIQKLVFKLAGITLDETKHSLVKNRLMKRLTFYGLTKYSDYIRLVQFNRDEAAEMVNQITTNETYFFREGAHFSFLQNYLVGVQKPHVRVWSAAASLGAEAYSIAMTLDASEIASYEVLGSDINSEVLRVARAGVYPLPWVDKIPDVYKKAYCLKGKNEYDKQFLIDPKLREKVSFTKANLLEPQTQLGLFDVIFLRNVLIYFNDETKALVVQNILNNLNPGGYLIISLTENLRSITIPNLKQVDTSIYQKVAL